MSKNNKQKIVDAMRELILKMNVDKITVKEIVSVAGVSRRSFYYHFEDIFDLMKWGLEQEIISIANECSKIEDFYSSLKQFAECVKAHYIEAKRLLNSKLHVETENMFCDAIRKYFILLSKKKSEDIVWSEIQAEFLINFFSRGIAAYFTEQFMYGKDFDTEIFAKEIYEIIISRIKYNKINQNL